MTNEEWLAALTRLSKRTGFSLMQIDHMARIVAQADFDPLPPAEKGDPFEFTRRKVSAFDDELDFYCINSEVPEPDAQVDLAVAWQEFERDVEHVDRIYKSEPDLAIEKHWLLFVNQWDWTGFWSVRHPDPEARARFVRSLYEFDAAAERIVGKVRVRLRRRGVRVIDPVHGALAKPNDGEM